MRKLHDLLLTPEPFEESPESILQLRERVAELEAENANLRQLEETVRRNARLVDALFSKSHDGFLLITPQMTFLRAIHSLLGNTDENVAGRSVLTKIHPDDRAHFTEAFSRLLSNPSEAVTLECRVGNQNGEWRWMEVEMTDMLDDPDVQAIVLNNRDITDRKKCQETAAIPESPRCCGSCLEHKC
jgi:PAS domain S-box-containing protein